MVVRAPPAADTLLIDCYAAAAGFILREVPMALLHPHRVFKTALDVTAEALGTMGVRALLLDIDGTLAEKHAPEPPPAIIAWAEGLKAFLFFPTTGTRSASGVLASFWAAGLSTSPENRAKRALPALLTRSAARRARPPFWGTRFLPTCWARGAAACMPCASNPLTPGCGISACGAFLKSPFYSQRSK